jgi:hypothetical protein
MLQEVTVALSDELTTMVEVGAGLIVGTVSCDGEPRAERAWAVSVVDGDTRRIRFVMSADDPVVLEHLESGTVSLTGAEVSTFRSVQFKGRPVLVEAPGAEDIELARVQSERFFAAVNRVDGNPVEHLRRMLPLQMVAVEMIVGELFDQTPGPAAGSLLADPVP